MYNYARIVLQIIKDCSLNHSQVNLTYSIYATIYARMTQIWQFTPICFQSCFMNEGPIFEHVKYPNFLNRTFHWVSSTKLFSLQKCSNQGQCLRRTKPLPVPPSRSCFPAHIYPSTSAGPSSPGLQSCFSNHTAIKQEFVPVWRHRLSLSWSPFLETINQVCLCASLASLSTTTIIIIVKRVSYVSD